MCSRWREVQLLPLVGSMSSVSSPPAKLPKLDTRQNLVFFTSGDEFETRLSANVSADDAVVNRLESAKACSQDTDSEVPLQCFF